MSVIVEFQVPSADFRLGEILRVEGVSSIELESLVPVGQATVPLFWVYDTTDESFVASVEEHPDVNKTATIDTLDDRALFKLDWDANQDRIFAGIDEYDGQLLSALGTPDVWEFELRFQAHADLSEFTNHCESGGISVDIIRVYRPTEPDSGPWHGLTNRQREALTLAVRSGYYSIPRGCTTKDIAADLGISDQAVTERLRRAIASLATNTLITAE
ncbi:MAG: putative DNA binding protein [halophilic archaeon J07HX64]|jgi:Predicted DNA binding protein|nr:MAG: putative DNA binding protein [halophilic archaeon J07HX64]